MARSNPTPKFNVAVTYSTTTPESVEEGDFEDTGFEVETEPATLEDILGYAGQYGIGPRDRHDLTGWWESEWSVQDYSTGEETQYALHVTKLGAPQGERLDDRTFDRINKLLGGQAYRAENKRKNNPGTTSASESSGVPALERESGSWIVTSPKGQVVELFDRANAEKAHAAGWRVETALQYLGRIHREVKAKHRKNNPGSPNTSDLVGRLKF